MKVILLYLVLGKLFSSEHFRMSAVPLSCYLVYTAFSGSPRGHHRMVFEVMFHRAIRIGRRREQCCVSHNVSSGSRIVGL